MQSPWARSFLACVMTVSWKLWDRQFHQLACLGEELALNALIIEAETISEGWSEKVSLGILRDVAFQDNDYELLFDPGWDGIENDLEAQRRGRMVGLPFEHWFLPWHERFYVHPFLQAPSFQKYAPPKNDDEEVEPDLGAMPVAVLKRLMRAPEEGSVDAWIFDRKSGFSRNLEWQMPGDFPTPEQEERGVVWHSDDELKLNGYSTEPCMGLGDVGKDGPMIWVYPDESTYAGQTTSFAVRIDFRNHSETVVCQTYPDLLAYLNQVTPILNMAVTTAQRAEEIAESQDDETDSDEVDRDE